MSKFTYWLSHLFKSKEERDLEIRMEYKRNQNTFKKYANDLRYSIKQFESMAVEAEKNGNHKNALACVGFIQKLQKTTVRVEGIVQRFEMMYQMQRMGSVMSKFMDSCVKIGYNLDSTIHLKKTMRNSMDLEKALNKLDTMSEQMDMVFDSIDESTAEGNEYQSDAEAQMGAEAMLDRIMGRNTLVNYPQVAQSVMNSTPAVTQSTIQPVAPQHMMQGVADGAGTVSQPQIQQSSGDAMDDELARLIKELKG